MLEKIFIKDYKDIALPRVRNAYGILASVVGIICNIILCSAKIAVGVIFGAVSITADGLNNLSDAGSSLVSVLGFRWANKPADKDHPFGHARVEYIMGFVIAFIVLFLGVELAISSIEKIIDKGTTDTTIVMMAVLAASILVKLGMFFYYRSVAKKISSSTLKAAAVDSVNDCIATGAVLACTVIAYFTHFELDGYVGIAVAVFIFVSGVKLVKETFSPLLGEKPSAELVKNISKKIHSYDGVLGIHDLIVHNYGPNRYHASVHVEVSASDDIMVSHEMIDTIERNFHKEGINLVIHLDPIITDDERVDKLRDMTLEKLSEIDKELKMHDFRVVWGENRKNLIFDVVMPMEMKMKDEELIGMLEEKIHSADSQCFIIVDIDRNYVGE